MRFVICFLLIVAIMLSCVSCSFPFSVGQTTPEDVETMFNSFNKSEDYVLLTHFELVIKGEHYDRSEIKYNGKETNILFLEEDGFYSYTYSAEDLLVEFLYTTYDSFETTELYETELPSKMLDGCHYVDNCFWLRLDDPSTDKFKQIYYCWNVVDKTEKIVDEFPFSELSVDNNRSSGYTVDYKSRPDETSTLVIVQNDTGVKKEIDKSILSTFEEGRQIEELKSSTYFRGEQVYIIDDDIYFVLGFGVGFLADIQYYYILKWNFNTEECTFITSTRFDEFQEWVDDMIILDSES